MSDDNEVRSKLKRGLVECLQRHSDVSIDKDTLNNPYPHVGCELWGFNFDVLVGVHMQKRIVDETDGLATA